MKKDYLWFTIIGLLILGYVLDSIAGPITLNLRNPYQFMGNSFLSTYPLTAVSVAAKAISLIGVIVMAFSYIRISPFIKASVLFVIAAIGELYAIQQLATKSTVTPITWTLGIAYAGLLALLPLFVYILSGVFGSAHRALVKELKPIQYNLKKSPPDNNVVDSKSPEKE
jgi:hypothetical protein